jgi:hypothetical protein
MNDIIDTKINIIYTMSNIFDTFLKNFIIRMFSSELTNYLFQFELIVRNKFGLLSFP